MARTFLIEAEPFDPATRAAQTIRLAGGGRRHYTHKGQADWRGGVMSPPKVTTALGYDAGELTGAIPTTSAIGFLPSRAATGDELAALMWVGAAIAISTGDDALADPAWTPALTGTVAGYAVSAGAFAFTLSDMAGALAKPLASGTFAGTGGAEGDASAIGRVKRRSWGPCFNVEGRLLRQTGNIFEFGDPARPILSFDLVKDKGRAASSQVEVAWAGSVNATLDALDAVVPAAGGCAAAPSINAVKWWTQPSGPLTADLRGEVDGGYVETVAAIAGRVSLAAGGPAVADLLMVDAARPAAAGLHVDEPNETAAQALDRLLLRASLAWSVRPAGGLDLRPIAFADPVETITASLIEREAAYAPVTGFSVGYRKNHRQHGDAEISAAVLAADVVLADGSTVEDVAVVATDAAAAAVAAQGTADQAATAAGHARDVADQAVAAIPELRLADLDLAAADRQAGRDRDAIAQALVRLVAEAGRTRDVLRDAGVVVDPATGTVRLYAVDQLAERTGRAEVTLDGQRALIASKASYADVDKRILLAQLDPSTAADLAPVFARVHDAEQDIDAINAAIHLKASALELSGLSGQVTHVAQDLDALAGVVTAKAEKTVVDRLVTDVADAQAQLGSYGDVVGFNVSVRQARYVADGAAEAGLRALLAGDAAEHRRLVSAAEARQEVYTDLHDGLAAEATARTQLAAQMGEADARAIQQLTVLADAGKALGKRIDGVIATSEDQTAAIGRTDQAVVTAAGGLASATMTIRQQGRVAGESAEATLRALLAGDQAGRMLAAQLVEVQTEFSTTFVADKLAEASARQALLARMGATEAALTTEQKVRSDGNQAQTDARTQLAATLRGETTDKVAAAVDTVSQAIAAGDQASAKQVTDITARLDGAGGAGVTVEQAIAAQADRTGAIEGTYTITVDAGGNVVGFGLVGSAAGPGELGLINADLRMGTGVIISKAGDYEVRRGAGFGAGADLVEWFGPAAVAKGAETVANSRWAMAADGRTYVGGGDLAAATGSPDQIKQLDLTGGSQGAGTAQPLSSAAAAFPAGGKLRVTGQLNSVEVTATGGATVATWTIRFFADFGAGPQLIASAPCSANAGGTTRDGVAALAGALFANPGSGPVTLSATVQRDGPASVSAQWIGQATVEWVNA